MMLNMKNKRIALLVLILSGAISVLWGFEIARGPNAHTLDFQAVYYGTRCLLQHHNPYNEAELGAVYKSDGGETPSETLKHRRTITLYVNLPTTFLFVAPLAMLPWNVAQAIWLLLLAGSLFMGVFLMWRLGEGYALDISSILICIVLVNSEVVFATGNTTGIVVGLCMVAVWCFLQERFVTAGVLCMAACLAIKPHDAGLIWLYFLLAGGAHRKRALQAFLITAVLGVSALAWVTSIAPHWMHDWSANMALIAGPGGLNEPGLDSVTGRTADMVIDLQAALALFRNDPRFYNPVSYAICGTLLLIWMVTTVRSRFSLRGAYFALAAIAPLTLLITYHRPYDAKLLLLTIPACAFLWAEGTSIRWLAFLVTSAGIVTTSDVPLAILVTLTKNLQMGTNGIFVEILKVAALRPAQLALLATAIFYLWVYVKRATPAMRKVTNSEILVAEAGSCASKPQR
jgi:hypothetical protein